MTLLKTLAPAALAMALAACSGMAGFGEKKSDASGAAAPAGTATDTATGTDAGGGEAMLDNEGLPGNCAASENDVGQICLTCTPRELPVMQCFDASVKGFDAKLCSFDLDKIQCNFGLGTVVFDLEEKAGHEKLYERMPLVILGAKLLLGTKMEDKPKEKEAVFGALDVLSKHSKALFTCGDMTGAAADLGAVAKKYDPTYSQSDIDGVKEAATTGFTSFQQKCKSGKMNDGAIVGVATAMLGSLPGGISGDLSELNVDAITAILGANGGLEGLSAILGGKDLSGVLGAMQDSSEDDD